LIAGISPHVRRFSVWAFLNTVTTALHSDFLFTTQEKHPLLTCIALKSLNLCTQTYMELWHHACITVRRTTYAPHATRKHVGPYYKSAQPDIPPSFAPTLHCAILRHTAGGSMDSMNVQWTPRSVTLPWNRGFYTHIIRFAYLASPGITIMQSKLQYIYIYIYIYYTHSLAQLHVF
jgi:hypothetical protein